MGSNIEDLPEEILDLVIGFLNHRLSLVVLARVSPQLNRLASANIYRDIHLNVVARNDATIPYLIRDEFELEYSDDEDYINPVEEEDEYTDTEDDEEAWKDDEYADIPIEGGELQIGNEPNITRIIDVPVQREGLMHLSNCREVAYLLDFSDEEAESIIHYNENDLGLLFDQNPTTLHWEPGAVVAALISKLPALRQLSIDFFFSPTYIDLMVRYALTDRTLPSGRKLFSSLTKVRISQARDHLPYNFLFGTVNRSPTHHQLPDLPRYFQSFPSLKSLHANHLIEWQRSTVLPRPQSYRSAVETIELLSCSRDYDFEEMEDLISSCRRLKEFSFSGGIGDIDRQLPLYIHIRRCLLKSHRETLELLSLSDNRGTSRTPLQGEPVAFLQLEVLKELVIPWRIVVGIWARHEYYDLTAAEWEAREEPMTKHLRAAFPTSLKRLYLEGCEDFWYSNCLDKVLRDKARLLPQLASLVLSHIADTGLERAMATAEVAEQVGLKVQLVAYGHTMDRDMGFPQTRKVLTEPYYTEVV